MGDNNNDKNTKSIIKLFHDGKSGLEGLNSELINEIINDTTRGSNFYNHKLKKEQKIEARVKHMKEEIENSTFIDRENARKTIEKLKNEFELIGKNLSHVIVHFDMDMFFVAVEIRDNPELADKPCAVGSLSMISTSNYVARKFGVRAGMPGFIGLKLCPQLQLIGGRFHKYKEESLKITEVLREYDETFVPYSLDEASIDLTNYLVKQCSLPDSKFKVEVKQTEDGDLVLDDEIWNLAYEIVQEIRQKVFEKTQLTCSAGISPNKMLSKICSEINKPNNQYLLKGNSFKDIVRFIQKFNVKKIPGIGPVQQQTLLKGFQIETVEQLYNNLETLCLVYTQSQIEYFTRISLGVSSFEMHSEEAAKSESKEETFRATNDQAFLLKTLKELCDRLCTRLSRHNTKGKTVTLKIKKDTFEVYVRSKTIPNYTNDSNIIFEIAKKLLLKEMKDQELKLRLIGIRLSNFQGENEEKNQQTTLLDLFKRKSGNSLTSDNLEMLLKNEDTNDSSVSTDDQIDGNNQIEKIKSTDVDQNNVASNDETYLCPVCTIRRFSDVNQLNEHIDYCLSVDCIMSSVREFNNEQLVLPKSEPNANSKRKSTVDEKISPKKKKITEYFGKLN